MAKTCDNKSIGVIVRDDDRFLIIKRKNYPVSYAFVAGHLDGDTFEDAARKEAREEVGISLSEIKEVWSGSLGNPCKRDGGHGHAWKIFEAMRWEGVPHAGSDAKEAFWATADELKRLANRTLSFEGVIGAPLDDLSTFTKRLSKNKDWQNDQGLEPVWVYILRDLNII